MRSLVALCVLLALPALAQTGPATASFRGFSGLLDTPNALVLPDGNAELSLSNERDPRYRASTNTNFVFALGILPFVEISGRFSEIRPGPRDLSGNAKVQLPFSRLHPWVPDLALGVVDLGSSVPYFRSKYAVVTESLPYVRLSLGYGLGPDQLDGAFGGVEILPVSWAALIAEYDTQEWNAGLKLSVPVPGDAGLRLEGIAKTALTYHPGHFEVALGVQVPLSFDGMGEQSRSGDRSHRQSDSSHRSSGSNRQGDLSHASGGGLASLQTRLVDFGFENVRVGEGPEHTLFIQAENNVLNHNELDAVGVILGAANVLAPDAFQRVTLQLLKSGLPLVELEASRETLNALFTGAPGTGEQIQVRTRLTDTSQVTFLSYRENSTFLHSQLILAPKLTTFVGTEVGPFDAIFALRPELLTHLWTGAFLDLRFEIPLLWTDNFASGDPSAAPPTQDGPLRGLRPDPRLENAMLYQGLRLGPGFYALIGAGLFQSSAGGTAEAAWVSRDGRHRVSLAAGLTAPRSGVQVASAIGSYRFYFGPLGLSAQLTGGRFLNGDDGARVSLGRDFGDTRVEVFYTHTSFQEVGLALTLPLTPRKDLRPGWLQPKGASRWHFRQTTTVGHEGSNPLHPGLALPPTSAVSLEDAFLNGDRFGQAYLDAHLDRVREAFWSWNLALVGETPN